MKSQTALLLVFSLITAACQTSGEKASATPDHKQLIQQYFEYFNKHDWAKLASMYADTAEFKDPSLGKGIVKQSRQQVEQKYAGLSEMFPDVHDRIIQIYPSGDKHIIVEFVSTGTAPDNSGFELPICTIFTIENGLITRDFTYFDNFEDPEPDR